VKLDEISKILGLAVNLTEWMEAASRRWFQAGQIDEVARYCEADVLNTYRVLASLRAFSRSSHRRGVGLERGANRGVCGETKVDEPTPMCRARGTRGIALSFLTLPVAKICSSSFATWNAALFGIPRASRPSTLTV
jgi:hypothetical protein